MLRGTPGLIYNGEKSADGVKHGPGVVGGSQAGPISMI